MKFLLGLLMDPGPWAQALSQSSGRRWNNLHLSGPLMIWDRNFIWGPFFCVPVGNLKSFSSWQQRYYTSHHQQHKHSPDKRNIFWEKMTDGWPIFISLFKSYLTVRATLALIQISRGFRHAILLCGHTPHKVFQAEYNCVDTGQGMQVCIDVIFSGNCCSVLLLLTQRCLLSSKLQSTPPTSWKPASTLTYMREHTHTHTCPIKALSNYMHIRIHT